MDKPVISLSLAQLALAFVPVVVTLIILFRWSYGTGHASYALGRMVIQLMAIGYVLAWIFSVDEGLLVLLVLALMLSASAWIALGTAAEHRRKLLPAAWLSISIGGGLTLGLITQAVLQVDPWYLPHYLIPLAGMVFANSMTAVSLAAERLYSELEHGLDWERARIKAYQAAMIPVINSLLAVGLVSLPGMMTGQILSGVSPLVASRYQIVVMCMVFASAGLSTALFLSLCRRHVQASDDAN